METNNGIDIGTISGLDPVHPGGILRSELAERGIRQKDFAEEIGMEPSHLSALIHGRRNITPAIAMRLEEVLGIPATVWLNLQSRFALNKGRTSTCSNTSQFVNGYTSESANKTIALADPERSEYGSRKSITVSIPSKDIELFHMIATRLGWLESNQ